MARGVDPMVLALLPHLGLQQVASILSLERAKASNNSCQSTKATRAPFFSQGAMYAKPIKRKGQVCQETGKKGTTRKTKKKKRVFLLLPWPPGVERNAVGQTRPLPRGGPRRFCAARPEVDFEGLGQVAVFDPALLHKAQRVWTSEPGKLDGPKRKAWSYGRSVG